MKTLRQLFEAKKSSWRKPHPDDNDERVKVDMDRLRTKHIAHLKKHGKKFAHSDREEMKPERSMLTFPHGKKAKALNSYLDDRTGKVRHSWHKADEW